MASSIALESTILDLPDLVQFAQSAGAVEYTASLQRGKTPSNECPEYNTKQSDSEFPVMLELWGI